MDEEERTRQRYKVGPRVIIPGFTNRKRASSQSQPPAYADLHTPTDTGPAPGHGGPVVPPNRRQSVDIGPPHPAPGAPSSSAWESVAAQRQRHVSAPVAAYNNNVQTQTAALPSRSVSSRHPNHNASHSSQLPHRHSQEHQTQDPDTKPHRRSMGGILNQHRGERFEHDAHVLAHTPSRSKRDSYPPHPAIVGAGPESPYSRRDMQARDDTGEAGYFPNGARNGTAGVGARYLGRGRYAESEEEDSLDGDADADADARSYRTGDDGESVESFVPPKKRGWKIWK